MKPVECHADTIPYALAPGIFIFERKMHYPVKIVLQPGTNVNAFVIKAFHSKTKWIAFIINGHAFVPEWNAFIINVHAFISDWNPFVTNVSAFALKWSAFMVNWNAFVSDWNTFITNVNTFVLKWIKIVTEWSAFVLGFINPDLFGFASVIIAHDMNAVSHDIEPVSY